MAPTVIFEPSPAQERLCRSLRRFNVWVCHRGFGKSYLGVHILVRTALERPGVRLAFITDHRVNAHLKVWIPIVEPLLKKAPQLRPDRSNLILHFPNDSYIVFFGSVDDEDKVRGFHGDAAVFDEYALVPPQVWSMIVLPALMRRNGGAIFMGTPKGRNHFYTLYHEHVAHQDWNCVTIRASESGVFTPEQLETARSNQTPEEYAQEYECSWNTPMQGAVYGAELVAARMAGRVKQFAHDPTLGVETWSDLGASDSTAIWFTQKLGREIRLIDYLEDHRKDLAFYAKELQRRPYLYDMHHLPHDAGAERLEAPGLKSIEQQLKALGVKPTRVHPKQSPIDGIQIARLLFPRLWFSTPTCDRGLEALESYHYEWDKKRNVAKDEPDHDWASHGADAFRLMATHIKAAEQRQLPRTAITGATDVWGDKRRELAQRAVSPTAGWR